MAVREKLKTSILKIMISESCRLTSRLGPETTGVCYSTKDEHNTKIQINKSAPCLCERTW